jgi:hypothetical protein
MPDLGFFLRSLDKETFGVSPTVVEVTFVAIETMDQVMVYNEEAPPLQS